MIDDERVVSALHRAGFDWVCLDAQHGAYDRGSVIRVLAASPVPDDGGARAVPILVRAAANDVAGIGTALDAGADGVIIPLVDDAAAAVRAVDACFYPPIGRRSWGPLTGLSGAHVRSVGEANAAVLCAVMIETEGAVRALDEIAAVEGVGMLFVGPFDLALALGLELDALLADESADSALGRIVAAARAAGLRTGAFGGTPERAARLRERGFDHVVVGTDTSLIALGAQQALSGRPAASRGTGY